MKEPRKASSKYNGCTSDIIVKPDEVFVQSSDGELVLGELWHGAPRVHGELHFVFLRQRVRDVNLEKKNCIWG